MKRETLILPLILPCLTDKGAAQLIEVLHELVTGIEHHHAALERYHRHQRELRYARQSPPATPDDPPF